MRNFRLLVAAAVTLCATATATGTEPPRRIVLTDVTAATRSACDAWKKDGFAAIAVVLDERHEAAAYRAAADAAGDRSLDLHVWIEVGRSPEMARDHPEWMASLGMHADWRTRFPGAPPSAKGAVVKAWPWVPVVYKEAFDAHLARVRKLLTKIPGGYRGVLLNDLQGGPASCGCGNLQCRWAVDYGVPSTATKSPGIDAAARFVAGVAAIAPGKEVIPVWVPECAAEDLAADKQPAGHWSTGYCGGVSCFEFCTKRFAERWTALQAGRDGPTAVLALHKEFARDRKEYGGPAAWVADAVKSCDVPAPKAPIPRRRLWAVVQGYDVSAADETAAVRAATDTGVGTIIVARTRIDQSYEPRPVMAK